MCCCRMGRCCCGCCSVQTGSIILGWLSVIFNIGDIVNNSIAVAGIEKDDEDRNAKTGIYASEITICCICLLAALLLLSGIDSKRPGRMIPFLVATMLQIIGKIFVCIIDAVNWSIMAAIIPFILLIFYIYFYIVVYSHYKNVKEDIHKNCMAA